MEITMEGRYQTRSGRAARGICIDAKEDVQTYTPSGSIYYGDEVTLERSLDLVPLKGKKTVFVNIYLNGTARWFDSEKEASHQFEASHPFGAISKAVPVEIEVEL